MPDLKDGIFQIQLQERDEHETSFLIDVREYKFKRMPMVLKKVLRTSTNYEWRIKKIFRTRNPNIYRWYNYLYIFYNGCPMCDGILIPIYYNLTSTSIHTYPILALYYPHIVKRRRMVQQINLLQKVHYDHLSVCSMWGHTILAWYSNDHLVTRLVFFRDSTTSILRMVGT